MKISKALKIAPIVLAGILSFVAAAEDAEAHSIHQVRRMSRRTARRTTRRVVRRRLSVLPAAYTTVVVGGTTHYVVESVHYVKQMEAGKVVYVEVDG